ncbi:ATP-binding cassette domain-containing protein [Pseudoalteromonas lipolytica]|uniref:ATP-binding cassette domain-containing protein n=1 Tax=Pseudoalteromonas lipolytica TaxID=570156 RepID=UPI003A97DD42
MPQLHAFNLCFQHANGKRLFNNITLSLTAKTTALVGRNGSGKSILASLLCKERSPTSGTVNSSGVMGIYKQVDDIKRLNTLTVAESIGLDHYFNALWAINEGQFTEHDLAFVDGYWDLEQRFNSVLNKLGLKNITATARANTLSGGQLSQLKLWALFTLNHDILILDEPSNHLDNHGKAWLKNQIESYPGQILLISHDRELLEIVDEIWELSSLGLVVYGGNFTDYTRQKQLHVTALENKLNAATKQQSKLEAQQQVNKQKAEKRANKGTKLQKSGSQPKVLQDAKKDRASANQSSQSKNAAKREAQITKNKQVLISQLEQIKPQQFFLNQTEFKRQKAVTLESIVLQYGTNTPLNLSLYNDEKIHLSGANGTGKSTLLKTMMAILPVRAGQIYVNQPLYYLDQHFSLINNDLTLLDNLMFYCRELTHNTARTLLASLNFRKDDVYKQAAQLSGGEKMKLAMCIVSHIEKHVFLLLDEPDNHLDLESKQLLADALHAFNRGFIIVSHDQHFIEGIGCHKKIAL